MYKISTSSLSVAVALVLAVTLQAPATAQTSVGLGGLIERVFTTNIELKDNGHEAHFEDEDGTLRNIGLSLNGALASQLATFPVASSSGGFTYSYDSSSGTFIRESDSFGPMFAERSATVGRGKWNAGINYLTAEYDELDGLGLNNGDLQFQLLHKDVNNDGSRLVDFFEGDVIGAMTNIDVESEQSVVFFNYGVTDRFDFGVAVPFVSVDLTATALLTIDRLSTGNSVLPDLHEFPAGDPDTAVFSESDSASGVGDVLVRAKYRFSEDGPFAFGIESRLPTGDEDELLGTGETQSKLFFIASGTRSSFSPHLNVGYTLSSGDLSDEINYTVGFDTALHPRITLAVDAIGRTLLDSQTVQRQAESFQFCPGEIIGACPGSVAPQTAERNVLVFQEDDVNLLLGAAGLRINLGGTFLLSVNALFPLGDEGLAIDGVVPTIGIDYSF